MAARDANSFYHHLSTLLCLLTGLMAATGCGGTKWLQLAGMKDDIPRASDKNPVVKIVTMWQPADGLGPDNRSTRGFAGRVMFITRDKALPSLCDGQVDVFVFDNVGEMNDQQKPLHHFQFPAEQWRQLALQHPALGVSYGVFIPYTRKGSHKADCAVRLMYTAPNGVVAYSDFGKVTLEGSSEKSSDPTADISKVEKMSLGAGAAANTVASTTTEVTPGVNNGVAPASNGANVMTVAAVSPQGATTPPHSDRRQNPTQTEAAKTTPIHAASAQPEAVTQTITQAALTSSIIDSSARYQTQIDYGPEPSFAVEKTEVQQLTMPQQSPATPSRSAAIDAAVNRARTRSHHAEPESHPLNSTSAAAGPGASHPLLRNAHPLSGAGRQAPADSSTPRTNTGRHPLDPGVQTPPVSQPVSPPAEPRRHPLSLMPRRIGGENFDSQSHVAVNAAGNTAGIR